MRYDKYDLISILIIFICVTFLIVFGWYFSEKSHKAYHDSHVAAETTETGLIIFRDNLPKGYKLVEDDASKYLIIPIEYRFLNDQGDNLMLVKK